jgi:lipopolysaccharide transport system permease protein
MTVGHNRVDTGAIRVPASVWAFFPDAILAVCSYLLAYRLRFPGLLLGTFLPAALASLPFVVGSQMTALALIGTYRRHSRFRVITRLVTGVTAGSSAGAALVALMRGFDGVSRVAFLADATFLVVAAVTWRGTYLLWHYSRSTAPELVSDEGLVDRSVEMASFSATFLSVVHYRELLRNLVLKDLKLKYRGSVFGFLWSLANPLMMIAVYTVAFRFILRVRTEAFAFFVLLGIIAWTFFVNSAIMSAGAIADNGGLVKSLFFPRAVLPTATVLFNLAQYVLTASVFLPLMLAIYRVPPSSPMLLFPVFLALQVVFTIGIALLLSTATVFFRDVRHLIEIGIQVLFWTTPIVYDIQTVPDRFRLPVMLSPMSPFIVAYHQLFFFRQWPDATVWFLTTTYALVALVAGVAAFVTWQDRFADEI